MGRMIRGKNRRRGFRKGSQSHARIPEEPIEVGARLLLYDRDSGKGHDRMGDLRKSAEKGINLYNDVHSETYGVVDLIRATSSPSAGYFLYTTFTAKRPNDEVSNARFFRTVLFCGVNAKEEVKSVGILDAPPTELMELIRQIESGCYLDEPPAELVTACCAR